MQLFADDALLSFCTFDLVFLGGNHRDFDKSLQNAGYSGLLQGTPVMRYTIMIKCHSLSAVRVPHHNRSRRSRV